MLIKFESKKKENLEKFKCSGMIWNQKDQKQR